MTMTHNMPRVLKEASTVLQMIEEHQYEAYFVGGCMRDFLLQRPIEDVDITTSATPEQLMKIFPDVIPVGVEHGTVIVRYEHVSYEITTFRHENIAINERLLSEDLQRRDFTINAIAMNQHGKIIDLFNGQADLKNSRIQTVGHANDRFTEDPLRILRAIRFVSQLNFTIERATLEAMKDLKHLLKSVAVERITNELRLIFQGEYVQSAIELMKEVKLQKVLPVFQEVPSLLDKLPKNTTSFVTVAEVIALFHYIDRNISITTWTKKWKLPNETKQSATSLVTLLDYYLQYGVNNWLAYQLPKNEQPSFFHLIGLVCHSDIKEEFMKVYHNLPVTSRVQLEFNGSDLQNMFRDYPRGRWISETLTEIEYDIVMGKLTNSKNAIKEWIKCHPPEVN